MNNPKEARNNKGFLKKKRNRQYDDITKEFTEAGLNLVEIKLQDFAESRKREMGKFIDILNSKTTSKSGHQLLPRHMRRRQMSHNPFRIPPRNRLSNLNVNIKSKCKKHKRKLKNLRLSLIRRAKRQQWLETHLWHSKRFYMRKMLDKYTIAFKRRDKSHKACYRFWEHSSVIHDESYHEYFVIAFDNVNGIKTFIEVLIKNYTTCSLKPQYDEMRLYSNEIYHLGNLIGPIEWFYIQNVITLIISPYIKEEVIQMLNDIKEKKLIEENATISFSHQFNMLRIIGPKSIEQLFKVFKACECQDNTCSSLLSSYSNFSNHLIQNSNGSIDILKLNTPSSRFKMNELIFRSLTDQIIKSTNETKTNAMIIEVEDNKLSSYDAFKNLLQSKSKSINDISELSNQTCSNKDNEDQVLISLTERTTFIHRKRVNMNKLNTKLDQSTRLKKKKNKTNIPIMLQPKKDSGFLQDKKYDSEIIKPKEALSVNTETYIMLIKKNIYYYQGNQNCLSNYKLSQPMYMLIFPRGYATDLLRRFVYLNTKAIGIKEYERFLTQHDQLVFPNDYPSTNSYRRIIIEKTKRKLASYYKKPPSKRTNYQKIGNPSPFYPAWQSLCQDEKTNEYILNRDMSESITNILIVNCLNDQKRLLKLKSILCLNNNNSINDKLSLLQVNIISISKGVPSYNDLLCLPTEEDIKNYIQYKENKQAILFNLFSSNDKAKKNLPLDIITSTHHAFHIEEEYQNTNIKNKQFNLELLSVMVYNNTTKAKTNVTKTNFQLTNEILNANLTIKTIAKPRHKIIGFITSGIYDYESSRGKGKGHILLSSFKELFLLKTKYSLQFIPCLLRTKRSKLLYYTSITI